MNPIAYRLTEDAYACVANNRLVFSDLSKDKYRCLNQADTEAALRAFPLLQEQDAGLALPPSFDQEERTRFIMRELAASGLVASCNEPNKAITPILMPLPVRSILSHVAPSIPRHLRAHWVSFIRASFTASCKLRLLPFRHITQGVEKRKRRKNSGSPDRGAMFELVEIFHRLRPYYVREYLCRFDSLALLDFLALYGHYPSWVFGVRSGPFLAHCWVQEGECVLDDSLDGVRQYTPIMAF